MNTAYVVTGMLTGPRSVTLDEPLSIEGGRIRLVIEATPEMRSAPEADDDGAAARSESGPQMAEAIERRRQAEQQPDAWTKARPPLISVAQAIDAIDRLHEHSGLVPRSAADIDADIREGRADREFP